MVINAPLENKRHALPFFPVTKIDFSSNFFPTDEESRVMLNSSSMEKDETSPLIDAIMTDASMPSNFVTERQNKTQEANRQLTKKNLLVNKK